MNQGEQSHRAHALSRTAEANVVRGTATTLVSAVFDQARQDARAPALADDSGLMSYAELCGAVSRAADRLRGLGLGADDVIAVQLPNGRPFVVTLLAAGLIGATVQMLHMTYRRAELQALLRHGRAKAFVGMARFKDETPLETVANLGIVAQVIDAAGIVDDAGTAQRDAEGIGASRTEADGTSHPEADDASRYVLLHTSGTTAEPKGVPISHRQFMDNARVSLAELRIDHRDVLLAAAPFTHLYGLFVLELALLAGGCASLMPAFSPAALVATLSRDRVTAVFAGPAHFGTLLGTGAGAASTGEAALDAALAPLRLVCLSGTAVPEALAQAIENRLTGGGRVIQLWGMSELQAGSYGRPTDPVALRHRTAGRPSPGTALRIRPLDESPATCQDDLPIGSEGRLWVRGPSLFAGYLDNATATAAAIKDGWFDTGDIGYLTNDRALVLTGRVKEIINRGGVKFNPIDVEAIIDRMPGVGRSAVVPMPDPVLGERACLFIEPANSNPDDAATPEPGRVTLEQVLQELDRAGVARFKWPERLEFVDQMPLTPTQKVMRGRLIARLSPTQVDDG